jgi:diguanylate cyclase (GGDEF)-like protein
MSVVDWTKLPDLAAVALLTCAFASVARRGQTHVSRFWLIGWILIALHFAAFMFLAVPGVGGTIAGDIGVATLADAGVLFMYASVPYRQKLSSKLILISLLCTHTLYVCLLNVSPACDWALLPTALLFGALPLAITVATLREHKNALRFLVVSLYCALSIFLVFVEYRPGTGPSLAMNGVLFSVYLGCCLHFCFAWRRATTGPFITIAGFLAWASVFLVGPCLDTFFPSIHIDGEVWNLPKYIVAVGMILVLLEDQIEHNKFLALHDELTGLPNRRLFQDRLATALERGRRAGTKLAVLVVDLDQFKQVNDSLGHHAGDLLLQKVGTIFTGRIRNSDTVARTGGDEFSLILDGVADRESADLVAQTLLRHLNAPLQVEAQTVWVGASIGVAVFPDDASDMESLCIAADQRMYTEKNDAKGISRPPHPGNARVQPSFAAPVQTDFRVAPERFSA